MAGAEHMSSCPFCGGLTKPYYRSAYFVRCTECGFVLRFREADANSLYIEQL